MITVSIDVGTTNLKMNVFNESWQALESFKFTYQRSQVTQVNFEMDMNEVWDFVKEGLTTIFRTYSHQRLDIVLTTAMHSVQLMDQSMNLVGGLVTWADSRGSQALSATTVQSRQRRYLLSGTPDHPMNPYYKLQEIYRPGLKVGSLKDILIYRLTGQWILDVSSAAATGLMMMETGQWDTEALAVIGVQSTDLPEIGPVDLTLPIVWEGKEHGAQLIIGTTDGVSSNYAFSGLDNVAVLSVGTSHAVRILAHEAIVDKQLRNFSYRIHPSTYLVGLPSNNGADVLAWATRIFGCDFNELDTTLAQRPDTDAIFLPFINGERSPLWQENALGQFTQLGRSESRESILYSLMLGMVFNIRMNVEGLATLVDFDKLGLVGGVSGLKHLPQLLADVLGLPIYLPLMANAETLGSIALVRDVVLKVDYTVLRPNRDETLEALYRNYVNSYKDYQSQFN